MADSSLKATLEDYVPGLRVQSFGGEAPVQGEGTYTDEDHPELGEQKWRFRYRNGAAQLYLWHEVDDQGEPVARLYAERDGLPVEPRGDDAMDAFFRLWDELATREVFGRTRLERIADIIMEDVKRSRQKQVVRDALIDWLARERNLVVVEDGDRQLYGQEIDLLFDEIRAALGRIKVPGAST